MIFLQLLLTAGWLFSTMGASQFGREHTVEELILFTLHLSADQDISQTDLNDQRSIITVTSTRTSTDTACDCTATADYLSSTTALPNDTGSLSHETTSLTDPTSITTDGHTYTARNTVTLTSPTTVSVTSIITVDETFYTTEIIYTVPITAQTTTAEDFLTEATSQAPATIHSRTLHDSHPTATLPTFATSSTYMDTLPAKGFSLSLCPSRIINPTYTPAFPLPTDYTWGCPPGYICHPHRSQADGRCNFNVGPPAPSFYCSPDECIPSPPLPPPQFWGSPVKSNEVGTFNISSLVYFNLNPREFGLDYGVFQVLERPKDMPRDLIAAIPPACFDECNDAFLEAQSVGKSQALCKTGSAFRTLLHFCRQCINAYGWERTTSDILPYFQQFLFFCEVDFKKATKSGTISGVTSWTTISQYGITMTAAPSTNFKTMTPSTLSRPTRRTNMTSILTRTVSVRGTKVMSSPSPTARTSTPSPVITTTPITSSTGYLISSSAPMQSVASKWSCTRLVWLCVICGYYFLFS